MGSNSEDLGPEEPTFRRSVDSALAEEAARRLVDVAEGLAWMACAPPGMRMLPGPDRIEALVQLARTVGAEWRLFHPGFDQGPDGWRLDLVWARGLADALPSMSSFETQAQYEERQRRLAATPLGVVRVLWQGSLVHEEVRELGRMGVLCLDPLQAVLRVLEKVAEALAVEPIRSLRKGLVAP